MRYKKRSLRQKIGLGHEHKTLSFISLAEHVLVHMVQWTDTAT